MIDTDYLLCFDPGKTTGWASFEVHRDEPIELIGSGMISGGVKGFVEWVDEDLPLELEGASFTVVSELFIPDGRTRKPDLTPLKIEGVLSYLWPDWVGQRNVMKMHAPDEMLKRLGLWKPGAGHDRDGIRHGLAYAKAQGHMPTIRWMHPPAE